VSLRVSFVSLCHWSYSHGIVSFCHDVMCHLVIDQRSPAVRLPAVSGRLSVGPPIRAAATSGEDDQKPQKPTVVILQHLRFICHWHYLLSGQK